MATKHLTAERLWSLLNYDDKSGVFTWRESRGRTAKINAQAGNAVSSVETSTAMIE